MTGTAGGGGEGPARATAVNGVSTVLPYIIQIQTSFQISNTSYAQ
jgi:hypothetical protein